MPGVIGLVAKGRACKHPPPSTTPGRTASTRRWNCWSGTARESRLIAGGHSLIPMMRLRIAQPERVIDINDLTELDYIRLVGTAADYLAIGAMTRHESILASAVIGEHYTILHDAERVIADPIVRNRGTIGGSLCQADPAEDLSAVAADPARRLVIRSRSGYPHRSGQGVHRRPVRDRAGRRRDAGGGADSDPARSRAAPTRRWSGAAGDWAVASAGAYLVLDGEHGPDVGDRAGRRRRRAGCAPDAEEYLRGRDAHRRDHRRGRPARRRSAAIPSADQRGPVVYKRHLADELTRRALRRAAARAGWRAQEGN